MKPCSFTNSPALLTVNRGVAWASAEVTVMRRAGTSPWSASDSASGKYLSSGAVAISTGAEMCAADRSGESDSTTNSQTVGKRREELVEACRVSVLEECLSGRGGRAERVARGVAKDAQRVGGRRIESLEHPA